MFSHIHWQLCETGLFAASNVNRGRWPSAWTLEVEEAILQEIDEQHDSSTRGMTRQFGISEATAWRILHNVGLQPFHLPRVQVFEADGHHKCVMFYQCFMQRTTVDPNFPAYVLFTDEVVFTREGVFNTHNLHAWTYQNPHGTKPNGSSQKGSSAVEYSPANAVPAWRRSRPPIGRCGPVSLPPRSTDLSPIDFFVCGAMKNMVYETPLCTISSILCTIKSIYYIYSW